MAFNYTFPEWKNKGTAPSEALRNAGYQKGEQPPADVFNWFWAQTMAAITELQSGPQAASNNYITITFMSYASGQSDAGNVTATLKVNNEIYTEITGESIYKKAQTIVVPAHYMGVTLSLTNVADYGSAAAYVTIDGTQTTYTSNSTINLYTDGGEIPQFVLVRLSAGDK